MLSKGLLGTKSSLLELTTACQNIAVASVINQELTSEGLARKSDCFHKHAHQASSQSITEQFPIEAANGLFI